MVLCIIPLQQDTVKTLLNPQKHSFVYVTCLLAKKVLLYSYFKISKFHSQSSIVCVNWTMQTNFQGGRENFHSPH